MSIYQGNKKVLGGVSNIEENKVKEIIDSERPIKTFTNITQLGLSAGCSVEDIFLALPNNSYFECGTASGVDGYSTITNLPTTSTSTLLTIRKYTQARFNIEVKISSSGDVEPNEMYIGQLKGSDGTGLVWQKVCTTKVADVPTTVVTTTNTNVNTSSGYIRYRVKNGICYVSLYNVVIIATGQQIISDSLPTPEGVFLYGGSLTSTSTGDVAGYMFVNNGESKLLINVKNTGVSLYGSFSYPVAES